MATSPDFRAKILQLYTERGYSMQEIANSLGCSVSVVRYWLDKNGIKRRSISEAINNVYALKFNKTPFQLKSNLTSKENDLKIAGIMLYWGEGAKTGNSVKFANSDPDMIAMFVKFLVEICGIHPGRLRALIHMYPDHDENELRTFWSSVAHIPESQFSKPHVHEGRVGTYKKKSPYGTLAITYSDKKLLNVILSWIDQYRNGAMLGHL